MATFRKVFLIFGLMCSMASFAFAGENKGNCLGSTDQRDKAPVAVNQGQQPVIPAAGGAQGGPVHP